MVKGFEDIKKQVAMKKKRKEDFFWQMDNHKILYYLRRSLIAYIIACVCYAVVLCTLLICGAKGNINDAVIVTMSIFVAVMLAAILYFLVYLFLKNSLQFKLGKLSSGLKGYAMLAVPLYLILLLCYIYIPNAREIITSIFTAVTSISAAILAIMGVHYSLVQQKNERTNNNNLVFELYDKYDVESKFEIENARGDLILQFCINNVSNNFGFIVGMYKICGCDIYQIGNNFPYLALQPNKPLLIFNIKVNSGDDQIILVYKDIGDNYYYLLLPITENKISKIEKTGKCDFKFLKKQIIKTSEAEKAVYSSNATENTAKKEDISGEEINISKRKEETKPKITGVINEFEVIVSEEGEIITDIDLLAALKKERLRLAKEKKIKAYMIFNNQQLVSLATFKPHDEISFISIYGLGKKKYDLYGEQFINIITNFK